MKVRILCLHGYQGSGRALRSQIGTLTYVLAPSAELCFVDAPSRSRGDFGWWHARESADGPRYEGWSETRDFFASYLAANAPFDGVLGFSQGAALAGLLVGWRPSPFRFAVMIGGFTSRDPEHARLYGKADHYRIPSLHMIGRADGVVEPARSRELAAAFATPTIVEHAGGHVIASDAESQTKVRLFVEAARDRRFAETP